MANIERGIDHSTTKEKVAWWMKFSGVLVGAIGLLQMSAAGIFGGVVLYFGGDRLGQK